MPTSLAFAGAGNITIVHGLAALSVPGLEITRVASRTPASAKTRAGQVGARACTYGELPGGADVVLVATPPACHAADALQALAAGAAVIVEKPLATTLEQADALVEASAAAGHRLGYAENLAFAPAVLAATSLAHGLGPIRHLEVRSLQQRPDWGDFLTAGWGGGVLFDLGVHPIAVALLLAGVGADNGAEGGPRVLAVRARLEGADDIPVDEHAEVELVLDTGLVARVVASWRAPQVQWDLQVASDTGVVRADLIPHLSLELDGEPVELPPVPAGAEVPQVHQFGYVAQLAGFLDDFAGGDEPRIGARFGRFVLELVCAASASAAQGGTAVALPFTGPRDLTPLELWRTP
jgi:myo-inositol 2-dehydrogenase/D-chiro-inositol 1-dehydrogenase